MDAAELCGVMQRRGSWYYQGDVKIAQGRYGVIEALKAGGEPMIVELQTKVKDAMLANSQNPLLLGAGVAMEEEVGEEAYE